jgi:hypothetical protein
LLLALTLVKEKQLLLFHAHTSLAKVGGLFQQALVKLKFCKLPVVALVVHVMPVVVEPVVTTTAQL